MVACYLWIYSFIRHIPAASTVSATGGYSHYLSSFLWAVIIAILQAALWWNPSSTFSIYPVITQLSLPYVSKFCANNFCSIPKARNDAPVYVITLDMIPHHIWAFRRLWYMSSQLLLLYVMVRPRYRKTSTGSSGSTFTLMETRLTSKDYCRISLLIRIISPIRNFSDS